MEAAWQGILCHLGVTRLGLSLSYKVAVLAYSALSGLLGTPLLFSQRSFARCSTSAQRHPNCCLNSSLDPTVYETGRRKNTAEPQAAAAMADVEKAATTTQTAPLQSNLQKVGTA